MMKDKIDMYFDCEIYVKNVKKRKNEKNDRKCQKGNIFYCFFYYKVLQKMYFIVMILLNKIIELTIY